MLTLTFRELESRADVIPSQLSSTVSPVPTKEESLYVFSSPLTYMHNTADAIENQPQIHLHTSDRPRVAVTVLFGRSRAERPKRCGSKSCCAHCNIWPNHTHQHRLSGLE